MSDLELFFSMLGEASTTAIVKTKHPKGFTENKLAAKLRWCNSRKCKKSIRNKNRRKSGNKEKLFARCSTKKIIEK